MLRQPRMSSSRPLSSGPIVKPMPPTVTQAATARARPAGSVSMRVIRVSAHNVSLRHLYRLWGRNETGLAEWIAGERLAGAAHDLRDPAAAAIPVAAVAREWGFTDPAHFSRRFRRAYAMAPREWRHAQLPQPARDRSELNV